MTYAHIGARDIFSSNGESGTARLRSSARFETRRSAPERRPRLGRSILRDETSGCHHTPEPQSPQRPQTELK